MSTDVIAWSTDSICLSPSSLNAKLVSEAIYKRTCRVDFTAPGFCVVDLGSLIDSETLRRLMVDIKIAMAAIHESTTGNTLSYLSAARFDQQETTRPHLDGGPDECFLMLGYEPSEVDSELEIADYAKCAFDLGLSPKEFMTQHNPMFKSGFEILQPYSTRVPCFSATSYQIVCINNSSAPYSESQSAWQGTLHTATILTPDETKRRVINSTMIASTPVGSPDAIDDKSLRKFVSTSVIHRRGYDKPHLEDDV